MINQDCTFVEVIKTFNSKNVLVIGDLILDVYIKGVSTRLSPEAPVPVVDVKEKIKVLGGAANTACNLSSLGATVTFCTVIGNDGEGDEAVDLLISRSLDPSTVFRQDDRTTIVKTRIVASSHVITRFDSGTETPIDEQSSNKIIEFVKNNFDLFDAIILSDYNKGVITESLINVLKFLNTDRHKFIAVDSKRLEFFKTLHPTLVKPNYDEAVSLANITHSFSNRAKQMRNLKDILWEKTQAEIIALTLDSEGSLIFNKQDTHYALAPLIKNPHVSGAGDTYLSAFTLAYVSTEDCKISAEIATTAAAIAITKESTSSCTDKELICYFNMQEKYISSFEDMKEVCDTYRAQGRRIVFTNGCFDILHSGHVTYLHCAKELGDILIVGVNTDESIKRLKGENRPINSLEDRLHVLAALTSVDHLVSFGSIVDDTPISLIKIVRPDVFAKGGDYTIEKLPEADTVEEGGGEIVFLPHVPDQSTTNIIQRINKNSDFEIHSATSIH
jgi:D-beta-D-heptose 7-phosphate kinase/D-beta-D-heptose 1-phosphate adenosyltransferase